MYYAHRIKFTTSIDANTILPGTAVNGFKALNTGAIGGQPWAYLLEDGVGGWEIGVQYGASARTPLEASNGGSSLFGASATDLTCTLIVPQTGFVSGDGTYPAPTTGASADALAIGRGAGGLAPRSVVIGVEAGFTTPTNFHNSVVIGYRASSENKRSVALGALAKVAHPGEAVIGSFSASHVSSIAVATDYPGAGGTFALKSVGEVDDYGAPTLVEFSSGVSGPYEGSAIYGSYMIRVQGTIFAKGDNDADRKVFNVDYATYEGATIYNNNTALFTGANTPAITLAVNASEQLVITVAAGITSKVSGVLRVDKLFFSV